MSLISIIIPLYNKGTAIVRCLDSIIQQSYSNWEILIIDDGSTDDSKNIIKQYLLDPRIFYFYQANGGVSSARNLGFEKSHGQWILYIDADDYLEPNALSKLYDIAIKYNAQIATGNYYQEYMHKKRPVCSGWREHLIRNNYRAWYFASAIPRTGAAIFQRKILENCKFNIKYSKYEDAEFLLNLLKNNRVVFTPQFVLTYVRDYSVLSKLDVDETRDFCCNLDFKNQPFWARLVLASLANEAFTTYPKKYSYLYEKYKKFVHYIYIDCKIRRFRKWRYMIYSYLYNKGVINK